MQWEESLDPAERLKFNPDGTATIIRYSPLTGKFNKATMKIEQVDYMRWQNREGNIQEVLPYLSREEREFLMTGYTPEDWRCMFPPIRDEDDDYEV
jgi:hypothetical protein